jgi:anti-sigma B factor antagonist
VSDLDIAVVTTHPDLVVCLERLWIQADSPSYRVLEQQSTRRRGEIPGTKLERVRLGRSAIGEMLTGSAFPKKAFLLTFVEACGVDVADDRRWADAWDRLSERYAKRAGRAETELARMRAEVNKLHAEVAVGQLIAERAHAEGAELRAWLAAATRETETARHLLGQTQQQLSEAKGEITRLRNRAERLAERAEPPGPEHMPEEGWEAPPFVPEKGPVPEAEQQDEEEAWRRTEKLTLRVRRGRDYAIVTAYGEIDEHTSPQLRELLINLFSENKYQIIVNVDEVEFLDTTGLGVLTGGLKRAREHDGSLSLVCTQERLLKILSISGLTKMFDIYETVDRAIAANKGQ